MSFQPAVACSVLFESGTYVYEVRGTFCTDGAFWSYLLSGIYLRGRRHKGAASNEKTSFRRNERGRVCVMKGVRYRDGVLREEALSERASK